MSDFKTVEVPGVGIIDFPASMTDGEIQARLAQITQADRGPFGNALGSAFEIAGQAVLPTLGAAGGGLLAGPPGMAAGGMAGEKINQMLGLSEPSDQDLLLAGIIPLAAGGVAKAGGAALKGILRRAPGAGHALHEMAEQRLTAIPGSLAPARSSDDLYAIVSQFNPKIRGTNLRAAAESLAATEEGLSKGLANDEVRTAARGIVELIDQHAGEVPFQALRGELRRLGERVGSSAREGGERHGAYKRLFRSGQEDLEAAAAAGHPAMPAVQALKEANAARKMEFVVDDLAELFSIKGGGITPRPDGAGVAVNFQTIIRKIEKNDSIRKTLGEDAYKAMMDDLNRMWKATPNLPAVPGQDAGSKRVLQSTGLLAGLGTATGAYFYGGMGGMIGGGLGTAAGAGGPLILGKLVATKAGRGVLRSMLEGNRGVLTPTALAVLATAVGMSSPGRAATGAVTDFAQGVIQ